MLCNNCKKNEATFYYKKIVNGKKTEYALCPECAKKLEAEGGPSIFGGGLFDPMHSIADSLYGNLFSFGGGAKASSAKKCDLCGSTFGELSKNGKVGCAHCYEVFADELAGSIYSIHGNASYNGATPKEQQEKKERKAELERLKSELAEAIQSERYEDAAIIRDRIRKLEGNA